MLYVLLYVLLAFLFGIFSGAIASARGRSGLGWFFMGLFFGPFGLLVAFFPALAKTPDENSASGAAPEPPLESLKGLASLRDSGAITEDDYATKKQELLKRL
jgi:hypothetical protein